MTLSVWYGPSLTLEGAWGGVVEQAPCMRTLEESFIEVDG